MLALLRRAERRVCRHGAAPFRVPDEDNDRRPRLQRAAMRHTKPMSAAFAACFRRVSLGALYFGNSISVIFVPDWLRKSFKRIDTTEQGSALPAERTRMSRVSAPQVLSGSQNSPFRSLRYASNQRDLYHLVDGCAGAFGDRNVRPISPISGRRFVRLPASPNTESACGKSVMSLQEIFN